MADTSKILDIIIEGATYEFIRWIVVSLIVTLASSVLMKKVFHKLKTWGEIATFCGAMFIIVLVICYVIGARPQQPRFVGGIQSVTVGGFNNDKDTVSVITMSVLNTGTMQSVTKNWSIEAVVNGIKYSPVFAPMPNGFTFTFPDKGAGHPESMTYHNEDNLLEKSMLPIQPGALTAGLLFVIFENIKPSVFNAGADFTVNYEDVLSKRYTATIKMTGLLADPPMIPGLHTDFACRVAPKS